MDVNGHQLSWENILVRTDPHPGTTLYNSVYRGDDIMIVNAHRYGINAYATPVLHLRRATKGGLFDGYAESFEQVRPLSRPASRPSAEDSF